MKKIISLCLIIVLLSIVFYSQVGKTHNVQVSIEESTKFSEEEINAAIAVVKRKFMGFRGCELTDLWYSESHSNQYSEDYLKYGNGSLNEDNDGNVIVLLSNFDVNSSGGDGSFEPNSTQSDWKWILVRDRKTDKWRVDDWGY
ncbi:DUF4829 domain-containing protein [Halalkalibacter krulwichiae]|uniref:DUF4829 domain-containing protein n=1 Tax=Halalkalibacter krulwichiae TaxID=199441 RepID=A0A1X9MI97_9BACI|nr:DUF4829 domain-containing protein [Halalkalibacter krulwichiae]ARK32370.1 hypothetical protein BkAM31D_22310 [Halalkalibacter krulwichiae]